MYNEILLLLGASLLAGIVNSLAGSGTLIVYPVLVYLGLDPHNAIATNIASLWVGLLTGVYAYRNYLKISKEIILYFVIPAFLGAIFGAFLLLNTSTKSLHAIVPFLILFAVTIILFSDVLTQVYLKLFGKHKGLKKFLIVFAQFVTGLYGSYFGAGIGFILLANLLFFGFNNLHVANALKILLGLLINFTAFSVYIFSDKILWNYVPILGFGYLVGGYLGGYIAQKISVTAVKTFIIVWGLLVAFKHLMKLY